VSPQHFSGTPPQDPNLSWSLLPTRPVQGQQALVRHFQYEGRQLMVPDNQHQGSISRFILEHGGHELQPQFIRYEDSTPASWFFNSQQRSWEYTIDLTDGDPVPYPQTPPQEATAAAPIPVVNNAASPIVISSGGLTPHSIHEISAIFNTRGERLNIDVTKLPRYNAKDNKGLHVMPFEMFVQKLKLRADHDAWTIHSFTRVISILLDDAPLIKYMHSETTEKY